MKVFLYAMSFLWIAIGCCTVLYTHETREIMKGLFKEVDRKIISAFEAVMGILLLISAAASHHAWLIRLIGLMAVIEAGVIFLIPRNLYDDLMDWYLNSASDQTYRFFGILSLVLGTAVLSWIL